MTALVQDRTTQKLGTDDSVDPVLLAYPVEASTSIYAGAIVGINAAGNAVPASANSALKIVGRCEKDALNQASGGSPGASGAAGSIKAQIRQGLYYLNINADSTITIASFGANVYLSDDNTVSLSDAGGTRPYAGYILDPAGDMAPSPLSNQVGVMVGRANPYAANPLATLATQFKARAVVTTLQAYGGSGTGTLTETANGAISAADGVTLAVGDIVLIQGGTTNLTDPKDSGPWQVSALGGASAKWVLVRPDWWANGSVMPIGAVIDVGGEGTIWAGTAWKSFAAVGSAVVGTNDPAFYVGRITQKITLAASTFTISNVGIRSATATGIDCSSAVGGTPIAATIGYGPVAAATPGYIGTASVVIDALASGMAKNGTTDTSQVLVTITNW